MGTPTIVSSVGTYLEVPDDVVVRIGPGRPDPEELADVIDRLAGDPQGRAAIGDRAGAYARDALAPATTAAVYLEAIDDLVALLRRSRPERDRAVGARAAPRGPRPAARSPGPRRPVPGGVVRASPGGTRMSFDLDATATARLRSAGQRYTTQRRRLIELLADAGSPVSIPDILAGGSGLKQSSVYRNLAALEQAGVVRRLVTDEEFGRYELAEDLIGHHHHLVCSRCGKMRDVDVPEELERTLERTLDRIAKRAGFARVSHRLDLLGLCADCAAEVGADTSRG